MDERKLDALKRIEAQLEYDYVDISGWPDEDELALIREMVSDFRQKHNLKKENDES